MVITTRPLQPPATQAREGRPRQDARSAIHEYLDELVDQYRVWADDLAERMTSVGIAPDGRSQRVAGDSPADPAPQGWTHQAEVVAVMADRVEAVAKATRSRLEGLGDIDVASEDLLIEVLNGLEMQLWMISAQQGCRRAPCRDAALHPGRDRPVRGPTAR